MTPEERHRLPTDTENGLVLIISGPSGVGKTTITRGVERRLPDAVFSVSTTTRTQTDRDVEGVDYHFVDDATFDTLIAHDDLLEWAEVFGRLYGTPRAWVEEQRHRGRVVILEIDVQGAIQVRHRVPDALALFILPPDDRTLFERLRDRRRETEAEIERRFAEARREIDMAHESGVYDHFIVNDELERAISEALRIVDDTRAARRGGG